MRNETFYGVEPQHKIGSFSATFGQEYLLTSGGLHNFNNHLGKFKLAYELAFPFSTNI